MALKDKITKMEQLHFRALSKVEPALNNALSHFNGAVKAGLIDPKHVETIRKELFVDKMVPGMGNRAAYHDFLTRPRKGVHIRMDSNDFGLINKQHGWETGNKAISAIGQAIKETMRDTVGHKHGKTYHISGDEFHAFVPNQQAALRFSRELRNRLEAIPPVGGTHNLSVSVGIGNHPEEAEKALIQAKTDKKAQNYKPGSAKTHIHVI